MERLNKLVANSKLERVLLEIFKNNCEGYESLEDIVEGHYNGEFSTVDGYISELTYYYQTREIFAEHFEDILDCLQGCCNEWCVSKPSDYDYNEMVWVTFEFLVTHWISDIEFMIEEEK